MSQCGSLGSQTDGPDETEQRVDDDADDAHVHHRIRGRSNREGTVARGDPDVAEAITPLLEPLAMDAIVRSRTFPREALRGPL